MDSVGHTQEREMVDKILCKTGQGVPMTKTGDPVKLASSVLSEVL